MLCPIYYNNLQFHGLKTMRLGHEQFFQFGVTALFCIVFLENLWLAVFFLWSISINAYYNFPNNGAEYIWNLFMACILYQITYNLVTRQRVITIFRAITALMLLNIAFMVMQAWGYDPIFNNLFHSKMNVDLVGFMGIKAICGMFNAICLPMAMFFSPMFALPVLFALYLSESSCAIASVVAVIIFLAYKKSKKLAYILLIPLFIIGAFYVSNDSKSGMMNERVNMWKVALKDALQRPIIGMGLDSFRNVGELKPFLYFRSTRDNSCLKMNYIQETGKWRTPPGFDLTPRPDGVPLLDPWDNPHNTYLSILYEFGLVGLLIILALLWDVFKRFIYCNNDKVIFTIFASFLVYLISSVGQFPFHLARTGHLAVILLACFYKLTDNEIKGVL